MKVLKALSLTLLLTACAAPTTNRPDISDAEVRQEIKISQEMAMKQFIDESRRLYKATYPVFKNNVTQCQKGDYKGIKPTLGFYTWNEYAVKPDFRDAANEEGLKAQLRVQAVAKGSPAARAGIKDGDQIVTLNGQTFSTRTTAPQEFDDAVELAKGSSVELVIKRDGEKITKTVEKEDICEYPIILDYESNDINAYTDGQKIVFSKGIMNFAKNDTEIALVASHELAHITMGHMDKKLQNAWIGGIGGFILDVAAVSAGVSSGGDITRLGASIGASTFSVEFEQEADYVGMYYLARAGYSTANVGDFWRRMSIDSPSNMTLRTTHPTSPERFLAIKRTHEEIQKKIANKQKLIPNMKDEDKK